MRRIRQGDATEAYWASTVREGNAAGADAAALECHRIYELKYLDSIENMEKGRFSGSLATHNELHLPLQSSMGPSGRLPSVLYFCDALRPANDSR